MTGLIRKWSAAIQRRPLAAAFAIMTTLFACYVGVTFYRAASAVGEAQKEAEEKAPRVAVVKLDRRAVAGIEAVSAPAVFEDVAVFQNHLLVAGPAGILEYDADGNAVARYRVGMELPPAPLVRFHTGVAADAQEPELFVATAGEGVLAFDGRKFRQIRPAAAAHRKLTSVLVTANGRVLMGTAKDGVLVYDGKKLELLHASLAGVAVTALAGSDTDLWIGTLDQGLLHLIAGRMERLKDTDGMPDSRVTAIERGTDAVYAGTPLGVAEVKEGRVARVLGQGEFAQALAVRGGSLLVGTLEDGTLEVRLDAKAQRPRVAAAASTKGAVKRILEAGGRMLELRPDRLDAGTTTLVRRDGALLKDNNIAALAPGEDGRLWIGYFDRGLEIVSAGRDSSSHLEDDQLYCVNRIVHDRRNHRSGVATANGFVMVDEGGMKRQAFTKADGLIASHVTDAMLAPDGGWVLGTPAGITFLDNGRASSIYALQGLVNNHVYALGECAGQLVAGTLGGVSLFENGLIRASYTTANSPLKQNWITAVAPVTNGCLLGTYGTGVIGLGADRRWRTFPDLAAGLEINPNAMTVTARAVYAGTLGKGLAVFDRSRERWTMVTNGLPSLNVTAIAGAAGGVIYIGTDNGLVRAEENALVR